MLTIDDRNSVHPSPAEQLSNRQIKVFPAAPEMRVCLETIHQAIYVHAKGELRRELSSHLRRGRTARRPRVDGPMPDGPSSSTR